MASKESIYQKPRIEKFKGDFNKVNGGCTINHTKTIQLITNPINLAVYTYLSSMPETWKVNAKQLSKHFGIGIKRIYKTLNDLIMIGLIERIEIREKGQFLDYEYYIYLEPINISPNSQNEQSVSPSGQKPLVGEPNGQNGITYKENKIHYKEKKEKKSLSLKSKPQPPVTREQGSFHTPTQFDKQEHAAGVKGYEWVEEWIDNKGLQNVRN